MQIETLRDILQWTQEFHQHLSKCLSQGAVESGDERAKMVLDYLADHEKSLTKIIHGFEVLGDQQALNTWFYEFVTKQPIVQNTHGDTKFSELDAVQIVEVVVDHHKQLIELYRYLAGRADTASAREMLESLMSLEEHEIMRMVQSTNRFEDL